MIMKTNSDADYKMKKKVCDISFFVCSYIGLIYYFRNILGSATNLLESIS